VKVYEDDDTMAFMDIGPVVKGHTLIIPKAHYERIFDTPPELLQKIIVVVQKVARAVVKGLNADGVNVTQANGRAAGQIVFHIHFHVIPRFETDGALRGWRAGKYESHEEMESFAQKIKSAL
jgi:histidine triad (HIT) family protein